MDGRRYDSAMSEPRKENIAEWRVTSKPGTTWLRFLAGLGAAFLGAVFLVAAWAKALDPAAFAAEIERRGLDLVIGPTGVALFALALEVFLGAALLLGVRRLYVLLPTAALVVFFLVLTGQTYYQDLRGTLPEDDTSCGCFGKLVERTPAEAFWQDLLLMAPALVLACLALPRGAALPRWRLAATGLLTVAATIFAWKAPNLPLDDLATRLRPGADTAKLCAASAGEAAPVCFSDILPDLASGEHVVVLADLADEDFGTEVERLNEHVWAGNAPHLWVVTASSDEEIFTFRFGRGPAFEPRQAPAPLLAPLYRTLPRSFAVKDGRVTETWSGLPPLATR